ncbi:hypothetical protein CEQ90_14725 [Lewinellaceae bacterium SD302]|nr:hypothetical protein CEQ90_14725 [Lewinellaceae bacterium SD302]
MKNLLFSFCLCCLPLLVFGQNNQSIDFVGGLEFSYRSLSEEGSNTYQKQYIDRRNEDDEARLNWRLGLNYNYRLGAKTWLRTGIRAASVGYRFYTYNYLIVNNITNGGNNGWGDVIAGNNYGGTYDRYTTTAPDYELERAEAVDVNHLFLSLPIVLRQEFGGGKRFAPYLEFGLSPHYHLQTRSSVDLIARAEAAGIIINVPEFNKFQLVGLLAFGMNYQLNEGMQLFAQPTIRYHFTTLDQSEQETQRLYNYGLEIGLRRQW